MKVVTTVFPMLIAAAWASAALHFSAAAQTPPPPTPAPVRQPGPSTPARDAAKTGAIIRGRVVAADSGAPLRKARVSASSSSDPRNSRVATTDAQRLYEITDLPAGRFTLTAAKGSFVSLAYGQRRAFESGTFLDVREGQLLERIDFRLPRGGVITGRVLDEFGEPAPDVQVSPMRYQYAQGSKRLAAAGRVVVTNDVGEFRLFGLQPGEYYVSATTRTALPGEPSSNDRSGYAATYYPGTPDVAEAQRVRVRVGQSVAEVTLPLIPVGTARLSGTAIDSTGKPISSGFINVFQRQGAGMVSFGNAGIASDGSFSLSNIPPGAYLLVTQSARALGVNADETAAAAVTVTGDDIVGIQLVGFKPSTGVGKIILDTQKKMPVQLPPLRLFLTPASPDESMLGGGTAKVNDDLTTELKARPGRQLVRLGGGSGLGWMLQSVRYDGNDVTDTGIEFRPNEDISGIEIQITDRLAEVTGLVRNADGQPVKDYTVVIFPRDRAGWSYMSRYLAATSRISKDSSDCTTCCPASTTLSPSTS